MNNDSVLNETKSAELLDNIVKAGAFFDDYYLNEMAECCRLLKQVCEYADSYYANLYTLLPLYAKSEQDKSLSLTVLNNLAEFQEQTKRAILDIRRFSVNLYRFFYDIRCYGSNTGYDEWYKFWLEKVQVFYPHKIGFTKQGWFMLIIPQLLPFNRKGITKARADEWLIEMINKSFELFGKGKCFLKYSEKCVLFYKNLYPKSLPSMYWKDFDNIESKQVTNAIADYLLLDDSPKYIDLVYTAGITDCDEPLTEVFLVPKRQFTEFLPLIENEKFEGFDLQETYPGLCEYTAEKNSENNSNNENKDEKNLSINCDFSAIKKW